MVLKEDKKRGTIPQWYGRRILLLYIYARAGGTCVCVRICVGVYTRVRAGACPSLYVCVGVRACGHVRVHNQDTMTVKASPINTFR